MEWLIETLKVARKLRDFGEKGPDISATVHAAAGQSSEKPIVIPGIGAIRLTEVDGGHTGESMADGLGGSPAKQQHSSAANISTMSQEDAHEPLRHPYRIHPRKLDRDAVDVVRRLRRYDHEAYLVGGCVRDLYLGLSPKDFDVSTDARPEQIRKIFRNSRIIGRRFKLAHIYFRGGKIIETATFRGTAHKNAEEPEEDVDLLITRDNVWGSEREDALRRDFTINGLFYDTTNGQIIDYVGGIKDLIGRQIRTIGDADIRLQEDPVRILRAVRFSAKLNFRLESSLKSAMINHRTELTRCAQARLIEEIFKLFRTGYGANCLKLMLETQVLDVILPQLAPYCSSDKESDVLTPYIQALDTLVSHRGQVSDSVILTTLLLIPVQEALDEIEPRYHSSEISKVIVQLTSNMALTRKMRERVRQIFLAQRHLRKPSANHKPRRKISPKAMIKRSYFADALDFYEIWSRKADQQFDHVQLWRARAGEWEQGTTLKERFSREDESQPRRRRTPPRRKRKRKNKASSGKPNP